MESTLKLTSFFNCYQKDKNFHISPSLIYSFLSHYNIIQRPLPIPKQPNTDDVIEINNGDDDDNTDNDVYDPNLEKFFMADKIPIKIDGDNDEWLELSLKIKECELQNNLSPFQSEYVTLMDRLINICCENKIDSIINIENLEYLLGIHDEAGESNIIYGLVVLFTANLDIILEKNNEPIDDDDEDEDDEDSPTKLIDLIELGVARTYVQ